MLENDAVSRLDLIETLCICDCNLGHFELLIISVNVLAPVCFADQRSDANLNMKFVVKNEQIL